VQSLRTLIPLDLDTVASSVEKTGRAVICQEATLQGGVGSDIARQLYSRLLSELKAPIEVTGGPWSPIPYSPVLEEQVVPGRQAVVEAARRVLKA
jgi:acetoin:2,6-dichlorophenolindophenol oxidoreductase subunit beta